MVHWGEMTELFSHIQDTFREVGCNVASFSCTGKLPENLDVILAVGPHGSLAPVMKQLSELSAPQRPLFVLFMTEQLPNPGIPEFIRFPISSIRTYLEMLAYQEPAHGEWHFDSRLSWITRKMNRFRYYGDLFWLQERGMLSVLGVGSQWIADYLETRGLNPIVTYIGSHPGWGRDLNLDRDIPVLWIGKFATPRRKRVLGKIRAQLRDRGIEMLVVDGDENPPVFGQDRTVLLNRTKIVLNVLRVKWDNHSLRFFLAAQNRALIVTEPTLPHIPFSPGLHIVESSLEKMADAISYFLSHERERQKIAENAHSLVTTELTMKNSAERIMERISSQLYQSLYDKNALTKEI
jgi:hypothetical protein